MKVHIETITPERATALLGRNLNNRPASKDHVGFLAKEMLEGRFAVTGQSIEIATSGMLLDGQHRLMALIKANFSCSFVVVSDLPDSVFTVIDRGRRRSNGDVLSIADFTQANLRASIIAKLLTWDLGKPSFAIANGTAGLSWAPEQVLDYAKTHDLERTLSDARRYSKDCPFLNGSLWGLLSEVLHRIDADAAPDFLQQLATGGGLEKGDVVLFVRNRIITAALHASQNMTGAVRMEYIFKAWNRVRDGRRVGMIKIINGELEVPR